MRFWPPSRYLVDTSELSPKAQAQTQMEKRGETAAGFGVRGLVRVFGRRLVVVEGSRV